MVTIDTLRADRLGCYGYHRDTSPEIDRLADQATLFERTITHMATTLPAHLSLMTSKHPMSHGVKNNRVSFRARIDAGEFRTFAQMMTSAGFETAAFVSATPVKRATGIGSGFAEFDEPEATERPAGETIDHALAWLDEPRGSPFFLWVHLFDPHDAYRPPAPYDSLFVTDEAHMSYLQDNAFTLWDHPQIQLINNLYDGEIRYADTELGRLFDYLREKGLFDSMAIVLTADHGEGMGQHDWVVHDKINNEQIHVPLIIKLPGTIPHQERRSDLVALVDVLPTLVEELDLPLREEDRAQFEGRNVFANSREFVFTERNVGRPEKVGPGEMYALTGLEWKYFHATEEQDRLYHLKSDPLETRNVIEEAPEVASRLRERILRVLSRAEEKEGIAPEELPSEHVEQLRGLGYVD